MISVGLYLDDHDWAAAVAVDGQISAALDIPRPGAGRDDETCRGMIGDVLALACVRPGDVGQLVVVDTGDRARGLHASTASLWPAAVPAATLVCPTRATAAQFRGREIGASLVVDDQNASGATLFEEPGGPAHPLPAVANALVAAARVARALGADGGRPIASLEKIAATRSRPTTQEVAAATARFDAAHADNLIADALASCPLPADSDSRHLAVQTTRAALATTALDAVADTIVAAVRERVPASTRVGLAGTACVSFPFAERLVRRLSAIVAPVAGARGSVLGAALLPQTNPHPVPHVALGPAIDEGEVKATLENCRLDFVYEPDWAKLRNRVSSLLSSGALVGWCQGRRDFGGRTFGSRSVLADPSKRYVRENVNRFLLRGELATPLPVTLLSDTWEASHETAGNGIGRQFAPAADSQGRVLVQRQPEAVAPHLAQLLHLHASRTGVAGLINVGLVDGDGRLVVSARSAVREAFSSAVDVLVLGRFLVSKDYWLIRTR